MLISLHQKTACATGRVQDALSQFGSQPVYDETHDRSWGIELACIPGRVTHLSQHRLVEQRDRVDIVRRVEVDSAELIYYFSQDVPRANAVISPLEDRADNRANIAIAGAGDATEIRKQVIIDKIQQFITRQSLCFIFNCCPVSPAIRSL